MQPHGARTFVLAREFRVGMHGVGAHRLVSRALAHARRHILLKSLIHCTLRSQLTLQRPKLGANFIIVVVVVVIAELSVIVCTAATEAVTHAPFAATIQAHRRRRRRYLHCCHQSV